MERYKNNEIDINTNNKSADQEQEKKPDAPKKPTPNLTGKYATQGVDGDRIKTGTDAQKQTGGQEKTGTIDIPTIAKQIMALSAADKTKIIQALTPKPAESIEKEDLVLENMHDDKTTYNLNTQTHHRGLGVCFYRWDILDVSFSLIDLQHSNSKITYSVKNGLGEELISIFHFLNNTIHGGSTLTNLITTLC